MRLGQDEGEAGGSRLTQVWVGCRVMPEVPQNMQDDIQRMELEARDAEPNRSGKATAQSEEAKS
jgi:hypothetical protein